jgi:membrane peptidoglycan carboxypeptidase
VPKRWGELNTITIAFGQGLNVAPLQAMMAVGALSNGGQLINPTFLKRSEEEARANAPQVVRPEVSEALRYLMRLNAEKGSARTVDIRGYYVGGKTGTAEYGTANPPATRAWFVGWQGKVKTATQMTALTLLLLARSGTDQVIRQVGLLLLYVAAILTCTSAMGYAVAAWPALTERVDAGGTKSEAQLVQTTARSGDYNDRKAKEERRFGF